MITGYQYFISPYLPPSCRFTISCSEYTKLAIVKDGLINGTISGLLRLAQCQPFFNYGKDSKDSKDLNNLN